MRGISKGNKQASLKKNVFITAVLVGVFVLGAVFVIAGTKTTDAFTLNVTLHNSPVNVSNLSGGTLNFTFTPYTAGVDGGTANVSNATLFANWSESLIENITNVTATSVLINATKYGLNLSSSFITSNNVYWYFVRVYNGTGSNYADSGGSWLRYDTTAPTMPAITINTTSSTNINMSEIEIFTINVTLNDTVSAVNNVSIKLGNATGNWSVSSYMPLNASDAFGGNDTMSVITNASRGNLFGGPYGIIHHNYWNWTLLPVYTANFSEGTYKLWITANDYALNNVSNTSVIIAIDKTAPTIAPKEPISSTDNDYTRSNTPKLRVKVTDVGPSELFNKDTGNVGCKYTVDNITGTEGIWNYSSDSNDNHKIYSFTTWAGNNEYETAPIDEVTDGNHTVWVICRDGVYHNTSQRWFFVARHSGGGSAGAGPRPAPEPDVDLATEAISTQKVSEGSSRTFALPSGTVHTITVKSITEDSATFVIASEPKEITVKVGESAEVDVDDDGSKDIKITLNSVAGDVADFDLEKLQQAPPATGGEPEPAQGIPMWVWIVVVVVILVIAGGVFMSKKK